jgi:hypothetical protein
MADRNGDRTGSVSPLATEAEKGSPTLSLHDSIDPKEKGTESDLERQELAPPPEARKSESPEKVTVTAAVIWMVVNTLATIGIVCPIQRTRKRVHSNSRRYLQTKRSFLTRISSSPRFHLRRFTSS